MIAIQTQSANSPEFGATPAAMVVRDLTRQACEEILLRANIASLACAKAGQPYIVPISVNYTDGYHYGFSMPGRKIEWMRENPLVGIKIDEIVSARAWTCVVAAGRYEEMPDTDEWRSERIFAWTLLQRKPNWWQPGSLKIDAPHDAGENIPVWYRIALTDITGRHAEEPQPVMTAPEPPARKGWMHSFLE